LNSEQLERRVRFVPQNLAGRFSGRRIAVPLRFALGFGLFFLIGVGVLLTPPVQIVDGRISRALVSFSHALIGICGGKASAQGAILRDPVGGFGVEMKDGCNGITVTILYWSAILAFPAAWRAKAIGFIGGSAVIQCLNIVRFISLFYLGQYSRVWFDFAHEYLWESFLVLDTTVVFWFWVYRISSARQASHAQA
jgi:exosortase H (IPTLxxWG-CTERM-specific)